ncbi:methyltransferase domain-containing protein [Micromonospora sp. NPDC005686]|uniref:methyltransferase domain-containing protein n=1 Tax=unclassified Micromonospora TaxID=2617518 RepID=UPI0033A67C55
MSTVSPKVMENYASQAFLGSYLYTDWGDVVLPEALPDRRLARAEPPVAGRFARATADLVAQWWPSAEPPARVFDVGGGTGRFLYEMARRGFGDEERVLSEPADMFNVWARRLLCGEPFDGWFPMPPRDSERPEFRQVDAADIPKPDDKATVYPVPAEQVPRPAGHFDLVSVLNVVDRVPDPRQVVSAAAGLLRPGGLLVLSSPLAFESQYTDEANWVSDLHELVDADEWSEVGQHEGVPYEFLYYDRHLTRYYSQVLAVTKR